MIGFWDGKWQHQHLITQFLQDGCSSWRLTNSVKALKATLDFYMMTLSIIHHEAVMPEQHM